MSEEEMDIENDKVYVGQEALTKFQQTGSSKDPVSAARLIRQTRGEISFQEETGQIQKAKSKKTE